MCSSDLQQLGALFPWQLQSLTSQQIVALTSAQISGLSPSAISGLTAEQLPKLTVKWALGLPEATAAWAQPTVVNGRVFVGTQNGTVYSLDAKTGCVVWIFTAEGGVRGSVNVGPRPGAAGKFNAYFSDQLGFAYAVDASTGAKVWSVKVDAHPLVRLTGSPLLHGDRLYVPTSSYEEVGKSPTYNCCTFRGAIVALDVRTGKDVWRAYPIPETPVLMGKRPDGGESWGPSGGAIWSAPSIARSRRSTSAASSTRRPSARAASSVATDVATQVMSTPRAAIAGSRNATVEPEIGRAHV